MAAIPISTAVFRAAGWGTAATRRCVTAAIMLAILLPTTTAGCEVSATAISFGAIDPLSQDATDSASEIVISCAESIAYTIALSSGSGSYAQRQMSSGSGVVDYQLFIDASRLTVWGDGSGGTFTVAGSAGSTDTTHFVYGRMPPQLFAIPGMYSDTLVITVTY